jgi:hypothetical protein
VWQRFMDVSRFVFLDETGTATNMTRRYGRAPRGQRVVDAVPHGHWLTTRADGRQGTVGDVALAHNGGQAVVSDAIGSTAETRTVDASSGDEVILGSVQDDAFVFGDKFGHKVVADFQAGAQSGDVLEFKETLFKDDKKVLKAAHQVGADVVITVDRDSSVTLKNVALASLSADDFRFVA